MERREKKENACPEEKSSEERATDQETSRRGFLKTSVVLAGAALLGTHSNCCVTKKHETNTFISPFELLVPASYTKKSIDKSKKELK